MRKLISFGFILLCYSSLVFATADFNQMPECVWDKYFTKADELRIKVDELTKRENSATGNKASIRKEREKLAGELKEMRDKKKAFDTLKKEKFFAIEEGLKSMFPDEYEACLAE